MTIIPGSLYLDRLYWISSANPIEAEDDSYVFSVDREFVYKPFDRDFGPLNISQIHKYCIKLNDLLNDYDLKKKKIIHNTSLTYNHRANSALLIGAYQIIVLKKRSDYIKKQLELL